MWPAVYSSGLTLAQGCPLHCHVLSGELGVLGLEAEDLGLDPDFIAPTPNTP